MAEPLLIGLDVGSTNVKAVAFAPDGRAVASASVPAMTHYPRPAWAYCEPAELWDQSVAVLRQVTSQIDDPRRIAGIAVASVGEAGVPLDARGEPTYHAISWFDRRTFQETEWLGHRLGVDHLFAVTGLSLQPIFSLCKILWLRAHEPDAFARTTRWLHVADYIAYKLSSAMATDHSLASRTFMFNLERRAWDDDILNACGIPRTLLAPLVHSGTAIGTVTSGAAVETGLPAGAVVATGGHDHVCGALAAGVVDPGAVFDSMGTAEALFIPLAKPITDPAFAEQGYTQGAHVVPNRYYTFGGIYTSGASVEWYRDLVGRDRPLAELLAEAAEVPVGSLGVAFLPHLRIANAPHLDARSRGAFVGLTTDTGRPAMTRALCEGLAFEARTTLEPLLGYTGIERLADVTVIGGGSKNDLLMQIKATTLNARMQVIQREEATSLGAALLAGLGAGVYPDVDSAVAAVRSPPHTIAPAAQEIEQYERIYREVYAPLYDTLRPLNHRINDLCDEPTSPAPRADS
ncbi:MAG: FGGY-family carbohydrate kinase [Thermomicrobiales bacterium]